MNIFINLKTAGKRKKGLEKTPYTLPGGISTLRGLITALALQEAFAFNARGTEHRLLDFLTAEAIADAATAGKIGFGRLYSENKANLAKAAKTAILGFEDGLFKVLINETQITELDAPLLIQEGDTLTFIRLTFLAGRLW